MITGESFLDDLKTRALEKLVRIDENTREEVADQIGVAAMKYAILRQSIGKDIVFDKEHSLSFEGDSGPYLQYTYARARSVIEKAGRNGDALSKSKIMSESSVAIERLLLWFPDIVVEALHARDPHYIATYCTDLAQVFNSFTRKNASWVPKMRRIN